MTDEKENNIIEVIDDDGTVIKCELYDIIEFEGKQYALLVEEADTTEEPDVVLMRYTEEGEESFFETIDDDDEFEKVSAYIETLDDEEAVEE
ncbi:MAG: DUF1292 domain-containing protein [Muribaculaceae bacterium]|nr:DUF1292 domain-containing protein [Muribaculaceae bacterium]